MGFDVAGPFYREPDPGPMILVPAGTFIMGDGVAYCGTDQREVTLTNDFWIGQYEVTNREYKEVVQWAYDRGYVTASTLAVNDNLDGSTERLVALDEFDCELAFTDGVFGLRDVDYGINPEPIGLAGIPAGDLLLASSTGEGAGSAGPPLRVRDF